MLKQCCRMLAATLAVVTLAACAATDRPDEPRPWLAHAGEPVPSVRYARLVDWQPLGRNSVMIRFENSRFFAVDLREPCIGHVREADQLGLDTAFNRRLRENDMVWLDRNACLVGEIRPLDWRAYTEARASR